jgi:hypothetical protein
MTGKENELLAQITNSNKATDAIYGRYITHTEAVVANRTASEFNKSRKKQLLWWTTILQVPTYGNIITTANVEKMPLPKFRTLQSD